MSTPHNSAKEGDFAKCVLMPGDPLRAKFIADTFLTDARRVSEVRNVYAYTGTFDGKPVSVMASGMGMPSIGIYSYELFRFYGVESIIRIGSAGSYDPDLHAYDMVLADSAYSASSYALNQSGCTDTVMYPSPEWNEKICRAAKKLNLPLHIGRIHSSDVFYRQPTMPSFTHFRDDLGCCCVEMESFALFHNANVLGKKAACLLTISDSFVHAEDTTPQERQSAFTNMMKVALEAVAHGESPEE